MEHSLELYLMRSCFCLYILKFLHLRLQNVETFFFFLLDLKCFLFGQSKFSKLTLASMDSLYLLRKISNSFTLFMIIL